MFYYYSKNENLAFRMLLHGYVTEESSTGVVNQAPNFGEDDYRACLANRVAARDPETVCSVDPSCKFEEPAEDFKGQYVNYTDKHIISCSNKRDECCLAARLSTTFRSVDDRTPH